MKARALSISLALATTLASALAVSGCAVDGPDEEVDSIDSEITGTSGTRRGVAAGGPAMVYPSAGQSLDLGGSYTFKVNVSALSKGTLCSLWQDGKMVWENLANDGTLGTKGECGLHPGNRLHSRFHSGAVKFMARDRVGDTWSVAREIDLKLTIAKPAMVYPKAGQSIGLGGGLLFKVTEPPASQGVLCSVWQNGKAVWENYRDDRVLGTRGECGLHADHAKHAELRSGAATFMARALVRGEWSDAVETPLTLD